MAMVLVQDGASLRFIDDGASFITSGIKATSDRRSQRSGLCPTVTKERAMTKKTKADLEQENEQLLAQVGTLTWEKEKFEGLFYESDRMNQAARQVIANLEEKLTTLQEAVRTIVKPSAVSKEEKDRRLANLPKHTPHQEMECSVHGKGRANREGYCFQCYCECMGKPKVAA